MKKKIILIAIIILSAFLALCLAACGRTEEDTRSSTVKPDIKTALSNYDNLEKKRSDLTADLTLKIFEKNKNNVVSLPLTEEFVLDRVEVKDKIYVDGTIKTKYADPQLVSAYKLIRPVINANSSSTDDLDYLNGETYFDVKLGYENGVYNLLAEYVTDPRSDDNVFWGATDDKFFKDMFDEWDINVDFLVADYLMSNGISELGNINDWIDKDAANKYFSTETNSFSYNITADNEKFHHMIFDMVAKYASYFDNKTYEEYLDLYNKVVEYIKGWVTVNKSNLTATVNYNGLPEKMGALIKLDININFSELKKVMAILIPDESDYSKAEAMVDTISLLLPLCGTEGQTDTMGMSVEIELKEQFLYGDKNVNFDNANPDLFVPLDEERQGRRVFKKKEKTADGSDGSENSSSDAQPQQ